MSPYPSLLPAIDPPGTRQARPPATGDARPGADREGAETDRATLGWLIAEWNAIPGVLPVTAEADLVGAVRATILARLREHPRRAWWTRLLAEEVRSSDFLCGRARDWAASLAWLCGPKNLAKVQAGAYRNRVGPPPNGALPRTCTARVKRPGKRYLEACGAPIDPSEWGKTGPRCPACLAERASIQAAIRAASARHAHALGVGEAIGVSPEGDCGRADDRGATDATRARGDPRVVAATAAS